jgi:hypothetical protein
MKTQQKYYLVFITAIFILASLMASCNENNEEKASQTYDPSKPVELTVFSPDSGRIRSRVILEGKNFSSDPEKIKVYFDNKRAAVVGANSSKIYVLTPRIAENKECEVSVVIEDDSVVYPQKFRYSMIVSVTTVVGNGVNETVTGPLETARLAPWTLDVDNDGNILVSTDVTVVSGHNQAGIVRINEKSNIMEVIAVTAIDGTAWSDRCYGMTFDKTTGIAYSTIGEALQSFVILDPAEGWIPRIKTFRWVENPNFPVSAFPSGALGGKYLAYNRYDGYLYTRYMNGYIARIDPKTATGMVLYITPELGETGAYDFDPTNPEWCYAGGHGMGGLFRFNINDVPNTWERLNAPGSGHRDGPIEQALFNAPWGVRFDYDGLLYICDYSNHCIRRYNPTTRIVETVLGIPGVVGFKDGGPEDALFYNPCYLGIDNEGTLYISDRNNRRVRKLAVE